MLDAAAVLVRLRVQLRDPLRFECIQIGALPLKLAVVQCDEPGSEAVDQQMVVRKRITKPRQEKRYVLFDYRQQSIAALDQ